MPSPNLSAKKIGRLLLGIVFAATFLFLAFRNTNWAEAKASLSLADYRWIILGLFCFALNFLFRIVRWWLMLRTVTPDLKLGPCVRTFVIAMSLNNIIPFRAGDFYRAFGRHEHLGTASVVLTSIVAERLLDLASLLAIFFGCIVIQEPSVLPAATTRTAWYAVGVIVAGIVFLYLGSRYFKFAAKKDITHKSKFGNIVSKFAHQFFESFDLIRTPFKLLQLGGLSLAAWLLEGALFICAVKSLSIAINPVGGEFALATGTLGTIVPSTPGYVGVFDFFTKAGLMAYNMTSNSAATSTLLIHVLLWLPLTILGGILMLIPVKKPIATTPPAEEVAQ